MKITSNQYAKTLYDLTTGKSHSEIDGVILRFLEVLKKNGRLKSAKDIIKKYSEIYNRENGIIEAEIISREKLSENLRDLLRNKLRSKYEAKEVVLVEKIDEAIKGGVVVRVGDEVIDASISRCLVELHKKLIRN